MRGSPAPAVAESTALSGPLRALLSPLREHQRAWPPFGWVGPACAHFPPPLHHFKKLKTFYEILHGNGTAMDEGIVIKGYLEKQGGWNTAWKQRFFILESCGKLSYFKSEEDMPYPQRAKGSIPINTSTVVKEGEVVSGRTTIVVEVSKSGLSVSRSFVIGFESQETRQIWFRALTKVQKRVHYVAFEDDVRHW
jgi:hypothetical protein